MKRRVYVYRYPEERGRVLRLAYFTSQTGLPCAHDIEPRETADQTKAAAIREHREKCGDRVTS